MIYPGFIGSTDRVSARTANAERTINRYVEQTTGTPKARSWLVPTPGLAPFVVLGAGPVRALYAEEGPLFCGWWRALLRDLRLRDHALCRHGRHGQRARHDQQQRERRQSTLYRQQR